MNLYYVFTPIPLAGLARSSDVNERFEQVDTAFDALPPAAAIREGRVTYAVATGTGNSMAVALPQPIQAYTPGLLISVKVPTTNTGSATVNVNGLGPVAVTRNNNSVLFAGDLLGGAVVDLRYDGTAFRVVGGINFGQIDQLAQDAAGSAQDAADSAAAAEAAANSIDPGTIVRTTGVQSIGGAKTFTGVTEFEAQENRFGTLFSGRVTIYATSGAGGLFHGANVNSQSSLLLQGTGGLLRQGGATIFSWNATGAAVTGTLDASGDITTGGVLRIRESVTERARIEGYGFGAVHRAAAHFFRDPTSVTDYLVADDNGIKVRTTTTALAANMHQSASGDYLLRSTSSNRYKTDVRDLTLAEARKVLDMRPVRFRSTSAADNPEHSYYGLIAEEVAQIDPRLVQYAFLDTDYQMVEVEPGKSKRRERRVKPGAQMVPDGVQYERLVVLLLLLAQDQQRRIAALEAKQGGAQQGGGKT